MIIARDRISGLEVYMLRRSSKSKASPDAYVFPGGTIDNNDRSPQARSRLIGETRPAEPAYTYAAIRETFEECGLLFSTTTVEQTILRAARTQILEGKRTFSQTIIDLDVRLDATAVHYFSRWITPAVIPQRFDARFFVARAPENQEPEADAFETYDGRWVDPHDALEMATRGELQMIFPTIKHLERVANFSTVEALLAFADTKPKIPVSPDVREGTIFSLPDVLENAW